MLDVSDWMDAARCAKYKYSLIEVKIRALELRFVGRRSVYVCVCLCSFLHIVVWGGAACVWLKVCAFKCGKCVRAWRLLRYYISNSRNGDQGRSHLGISAECGCVRWSKAAFAIIPAAPLPHSKPRTKSTNRTRINDAQLPRATDNSRSLNRSLVWGR